MRFVFVAFLLFIQPPVIVFTGRIVRVINGDSVVLLTEDRQEVKIRLAGIDCPEKKQDYGQKATIFVRELCCNKVVRVCTAGTDVHDRILGILYVDSINVNEALVRHGLAWHYVRYSGSHRLDSLGQLARKEKLNIWSMDKLVPPWEYRKLNKKK